MLITLQVYTKFWIAKGAAQCNQDQGIHGAFLQKLSSCYNTSQIVTAWSVNWSMFLLREENQTWLALILSNN